MSEQLARRLRQAETMRREVALVDKALQQLSPAERMVLQMLVVAPEKGNTGRLCQMLDVERSTVYRWKERAVQKMETALR